MAPPEAPQLRFLSEAANLLASQSPSTAAHLFSVHTHLLHDDFKPLNVRQQKHHCGGCGSIRQSRCSQITQVKPKAKARVISKLDIASTGGATVYKCLRCNQRAVHPRKRTPKPVSKAPSRVSTSTASPVPTTTKSAPADSSALQALSAESAPPKTADNANSKKRAKARKQGGLQALLASKKNTQPSLDLFDFLQ